MALPPICLKVVKNLTETVVSYGETPADKDSLVLTAGDLQPFYFHFQENLTGTLSDQDLSGLTSFRVVLRAGRYVAATLYAFEDTYNTGYAPANEDLATGLATSLLDLSGAALTNAIANSETTTAWLEVSVIDASARPGTLMQVQCTVRNQLDDGGVISPPDPEPSYYTADEVLALVGTHRIVTTDTTLSGTTNYRDTYLVDVSGGNVIMTLFDPTSYTNACPTILVAATGNTMTIRPATGDTINGVTGDHTFTDLGDGLRLHAYGANWIAERLVTLVPTL